MTGILEKVKQWLGRSGSAAEDESAGGEPVATPPGGDERETSTNAQPAGADGQPWSGND